MLKSISISNFKAIKSKPLILSNLAQVNYLVGKNACGKSGILEALTILYYFHKKNIERLEKELVSVHINMVSIWAYDNRVRNTSYIKLTGLTGGSIIHSGYRNLSVGLVKNDLMTNFILVESDVKSTQSLTEVGSVIANDPKWDEDFIINPLNTVYLTISNSNLLFITTKNIPPRYYKVYKNIIKKFIPEFEIASELSHIVIDESIFTDNQISGGQLKILSLINQVFSTNFWKAPTLFLIDEPENSLHPEFQKIIPEILLSLSIITKQKNNYSQFFIATHSPFIISAATQFSDTQKVYLIEDGQTVDLDGKLGQGQEGYSGGECLLAVNKMLGSSIDDIAPHTIIFCERTLKVFLENMFKIVKSKNAIILTENAGGQDDKIKIMTEIFDSVRKSDKCNLLNYKIYGVIDQCGKEVKWKEQLNNKLLVLNETELERLYNIDKVNEFLKSKKLPVWDKSTDPAFAINYCKIISGVDKGDLKVELAEFMGKSTTLPEFETFCPELYNLIF